jgi:hypothetical protein
MSHLIRHIDYVCNFCTVELSILNLHNRTLISTTMYQNTITVSRYLAVIFLPGNISRIKKCKLAVSIVHFSRTNYKGQNKKKQSHKHETFSHTGSEHNAPSRAPNRAKMHLVGQRTGQTCTQWGTE